MGREAFIVSVLRRFTFRIIFLSLSGFVKRRKGSCIEGVYNGATTFDQLNVLPNAPSLPKPYPIETLSVT